MALGLNKAVTNAQRVQWSITSNFYVEMHPVEQLITETVGWSAESEEFNNIIQLSIKNVDLPQHTADLIEKMIAGYWHISRNEDELFVFSVTFRDLWGGSLYRMFKNIWNLGKQLYPNYSTFYIKVVLTHGANGSEPVVFETPDAFLTSISQVQLSHENNEIMEFTVEFKTNEPYADFTTAISSLDGKQKDIKSLTQFKQKLAGEYSRLLEKTAEKLKSLASGFLGDKLGSAKESITKKIKSTLKW